MNKDLHDIDELFLSGLEGYEETPSAGVKDALDAALDKKEAEEYKKRFIIWKSAALLLLLLLAGFILFDSSIIKTGRNKKSTIADASENTIKVPVKTTSSDNESQTPADNTALLDTGSTNENKQVNTKSNNYTLLQQQTESLFNISSPATVRKKSSPNEKQPWQGITTEDALTDQRINPLQKPDKALSLQKINRSSVLSTGNDKIASHFFSSILAPEQADKKNKPVAKNEPADSKQKHKTNFNPFWLLSARFSYEQAGYKLDSDDPITASTVRHREVHEPSFSASFLLTRQVAPRWGVQTGLGYTATQVGISPQKMYALQLPGGDIAYKFIASSGYAYIKLNGGPPPAVGDSITTSDAKHLLKHVSVPLSVKYKMGKNKFIVSPVAGVEANFITSAKVEVGVDLASNREIVTVNKLKGIKSFYWSAVAGIEASYQVNKKLSVNVQPLFRYALSPITKGNVVETFPNSFGIGAGVTIKF